jgi:hypothetical protein
LLLSSPQVAQGLIQADNTMTAASMFNYNNLDCYDFSKLNSSISTAETTDGVVIINNLSGYYKPGCTPKYDQVITTVRISAAGDALYTRVDMTKGTGKLRAYYESWKN